MAKKNIQNQDQDLGQGLAQNVTTVTVHIDDGTSFTFHPSDDYGQAKMNQLLQGLLATPQGKMMRLEGLVDKLRHLVFDSSANTPPAQVNQIKATVDQIIQSVDEITDAGDVVPQSFLTLCESLKQRKEDVDYNTDPLSELTDLFESKSAGPSSPK